MAYGQAGQTGVPVRQVVKTGQKRVRDSAPIQHLLMAGKTVLV